MKKYEICFISCIWDRCKNVQYINTIEIYYSINEKNKFIIQYKFHESDFIYWLEIIKEHKKNLNDLIIYDNDEILENIPKNTSKLYNTYILESSDFNLYRNINSIPCLQNKTWNNINEQLILNTITGEPLF